MSTMMDAQRGFVHAALFYRSEQEYLDAVLPYLLDGLEADQPVLVAVPGDNLALVTDALGLAASRASLHDSAEVGRNPARLLALEARFIAEHPGRVPRMVGETIWPARTVEEYPACVQHEALVNSAFVDHQAIGLCPFDAGGLDEGALADARNTHPLLWQDGSLQASDDYAPEEALERYNQPLTNDGTGASYIVGKVTDLSAARSLAGRYASWVGLPADAVAAVQLIVNELATNSLQHANSDCRLAFWRRNGHLVCEARDRGRMEDPLAGRLPPKPGDVGGRGLFLVNELADLVRRYTTPEGTTIQAHLRLAPAPG